MPIYEGRQRELSRPYATMSLAYRRYSVTPGSVPPCSDIHAPCREEGPKMPARHVDRHRLEVSSGRVWSQIR